MCARGLVAENLNLNDMISQQTQSFKYIAGEDLLKQRKRFLNEEDPETAAMRPVALPKITNGETLN